MISAVLSLVLVVLSGLNVAAQKASQESAPTRRTVPEGVVQTKQLLAKFNKVAQQVTELNTSFASEKRRLQSKIPEPGDGFRISSGIEDRLSVLQKQHERKVAVLRAELKRVSSAWVITRFEEIEIPATDLPFREARAFAGSASKLQAAARELSHCFARYEAVERRLQELTATKGAPVSESDRQQIAEMKTRLEELRKSGETPEVEHQEMRISVVERAAELSQRQREELQMQLATRRQLEDKIAEFEFDILLMLNSGNFPEKDLARLRSLGKLARKKFEITTWLRLFALYLVYEEIHYPRPKSAKKQKQLAEFANKLTRIIETEKSANGWRGVIEQAHRFGFRSFAPRREHAKFLDDLLLAVDADQPLLAWLDKEEAWLASRPLFKAVAIDEWLERTVKSKTISVQEFDAGKQLVRSMWTEQPAPIVIKTRTELGETQQEYHVLQLLEEVGRARSAVSDLHHGTTVFYSGRGLSGAVDLLGDCRDEALAAEVNRLNGKPSKPRVISGDSDDLFGK